MKRPILLNACLLFILTALTTFLPAQSNSDMTGPDVELFWKKVDSLMNEGLFQSAQQQLESFRPQLNPRQQPDQFAKATLYLVLCSGALSEDGQYTALQRLLAEAQHAEGVARPIVQSAAAELFTLYRQQQYWYAQDRTPTEQTDSVDIATWSLKRMDDAIATLYLQSLEPAEAWQAIPLDSLAGIIDAGIQTYGLRPTLYDVLLHRAIDYFVDSRSYLSSGTPEALLQDPVLFAPADIFVQAEWTGMDGSTISLATRLFQQVIQWRIGAPDNLAALIDVDLKRLQFARNQSIRDDADERYRQALQDLLKKYGGQKGAEMVYFELASFFQARGRKYDPQRGDAYRYDLSQALDIAEECIALFPETYAAQRCSALMKSIQRPELEVDLEEVVLPESPALISVSYKNLEAFYIRWRSCTESQYQDYVSSYGEVRAKTLSSMPIVRSESYSLPEMGDYQQHRTEVMTGGLPPGRYIIQFSAQQDFSMDNMREAGLLPVQVSKMGFLSRVGADGGRSFMVFNRKDGQPLANVDVTLFSVGDRLNWKKMGQLKTDTDGFAQVLEEKDRFVVRLALDGDVLYSTNRYYARTYDPYTSDNDRVAFFLDRAIYRPGQSMFFKGIALRQKEGGLPEIRPNDSITVALYDANYQEVIRETFQTNAFGTFNGTFKLPVGVLAGRMQLRVLEGAGHVFFQVEEYKRPTFALSFDPLGQPYRLRDSVIVTGEARTYAGSALGNQSFTYRVERQSIIPWYWRWSRSFFPGSGQPETLTTGEGRTNADGKFEVPFTAEPDYSIKPELNPSFAYSVTVVVTDLTGETHEMTKTIRLSDAAFQFSVDVDQQMALDGMAMPVFNVTDAEGEKAEARISWRIKRLDAPQVLFRERYWSLPDVWAMDSVEYQTAFPEYTYKDQQNPEVWAVLDSSVYVEEKAADAQARWEAFIHQSGHYVLEASAQMEGEPVVERRVYFSVTDPTTGQLPAGEVWWHRLSQKKAEPGDTLAIQLGSQGPGKILLEMERDGNLIVSKWIPVDGTTTYFYEVQEADRGNLMVYLTAAFDNRVYQEHILVEIPWTNKKLDIRYETFRDKLRPGQEEEWRLIISGPDQEAVAAELVATLYDGSLDAILPHRWDISLYPSRYGGGMGWEPAQFGSVGDRIIFPFVPGSPVERRTYPFLKWPELFRRIPNSYNLVQSTYSRAERTAARSGELNEIRMMAAAPPPEAEEAITADTYSMDMEKSKRAEPDSGGSETQPAELPLAEAPLQIRKDLDETVFFKPDLRTNEKGELVIAFRMKEALTKWVFLGLAHTADLKYGLTRNEVITQKELMVQPNAPRFVRQGDSWVYTARISNMTDEPMIGTATLELLEATTMDRLNTEYQMEADTVPFEVLPQGSTLVSWSLEVPADAWQPLTHRVMARSGKYSDGEESTTPVLTNRMLVTETHPFSVKPGEKKTVTVSNLASPSTTSTGQQLVFDYTANPAWLAVKSMPYLMEFPHECSEQLFSRYYANALGQKLVMDYPVIQSVFENWKTAGRLESNLTRNEDLKSALNQETPWVLEGQSETVQQQQLAMLFDAEKLSSELSGALAKLIRNQNSSGGFSWFAGGPDSWFITQHIVAGFGELQQLGISWADAPQAEDMLVRAIDFLDKRIIDHYNNLVERNEGKKPNANENHLNGLVIHYLYTRSLFEDIHISEELRPILGFYQQQGTQFWMERSIYEQGLLGLAAEHSRQMELSARIAQSLKERAFQTEDRGTYWPYDRGYAWNERPLETHALLMSFFNERKGDEALVQEMKVWLLKNKQTNHWKTTKATTAAIYALLKTNGGSWVLTEPPVAGVVFPKGKKKDYQRKVELAVAEAEAGTGSWQARWTADEAKPELATVQVENPGEQINWGSLTWQYFEDLDKIATFEETPLVLRKQLYIKSYTEEGAALLALEEGHGLQPGDELVVRVDVQVDRPMEYIHLKDMRAAGLEPIQTISGYKYQGGLGYYQTTGDLATHFFIDYLPRGRYVLEYSLRATHQGTFSNGISTIQSMYAPEFSSHSEGHIVRIGEQ